MPTPPDSATAQLAAAALRAEPATVRRRSSQAILHHPALYAGPHDGQVAGRCTRPGCCAASAGDRHDRMDLARCNGGTAALLSTECRRLGRHALARHRDVAGPLVDRAVRPQSVCGRPRQNRRSRTTRTRCCEEALGFWRKPALGETRRSAACSRFPARPHSAMRPGRSGSSSSTRRWCLNALRHLIAVSPEMQAA